MNIIDNQKGFTLVEMLVVINISFLIITAVVSLYLLANKYFFSTTKRFEEKEATLNFISKLEDSIQKADRFTVIVNQDSLQICSYKDTILFSKDKLRSKIIPSLDNIKSFGYKLSFSSGKEFVAVNDNSPLTYAGNQKYFFSSDSIISVFISIERDKKYSSVIYNNPTPYKLFRNL